VVADVAMFYGERTGGIRTYLNEKAKVAAKTRRFEHHVIVPGPREQTIDGRHETPSLRLAASNGYRIPLGMRALKRALRSIQPDFVLLHDPFWRPHGVTELSQSLGATVVAVHHASPALNAAAIPGPDVLYLPVMRRVYRHAYRDVDAVMSVVDSKADSGREATIPLRFGLDPIFQPAPASRSNRLLYVGRLSLEKRIDHMFKAAARFDPPRPVMVVGDGPARRTLLARAARSGLDDVSFHPFVSDRAALAKLYREAGCVVDPVPHETFGLVVFEAAASGGCVVAVDSTPSSRIADGLIDAFPAADVDGLVRAIERAEARSDRAATAAALAERYTWENVFEAELEALKELRRESDLHQTGRAAARPRITHRSPP
jgi:alpha-1,6-mannosyltransferase